MAKILATPKIGTVSSFNGVSVVGGQGFFFVNPENQDVEGKLNTGFWKKASDVEFPEVAQNAVFNTKLGVAIAKYDATKDGAFAEFHAKTLQAVAQAYADELNPAKTEGGKAATKSSS